MKQNTRFSINLFLNNNLVVAKWNSSLKLYLLIYFSLVAEYQPSQNIREYITSEVYRIPSITKSFY